MSTPRALFVLSTLSLLVLAAACADTMPTSDPPILLAGFAGVSGGAGASGDAGAGGEGNAAGEAAAGTGG